MLNGLMRGTVFAQPDRIVGEDIDRGDPHQCSQPNGGSHIVAKYEKSSAIRDQAAEAGHAIEHPAHAMLPYTEMEVACMPIFDAERRLALDVCLIRSGEVRGSADQFREGRGERVQGRARGGAGRQSLCIGLECRQARRQVCRKLMPLGSGELRCKFWMGGVVALELFVPGLVKLLALTPEFPEVFTDVIRDEKARLERPAQLLLGARQLLFARGFAVRSGSVLSGGQTIANVRANHQNRRTIVGFGSVDGGVDSIEVVAIVDRNNVPIVGPKSGGTILGKGKIGASIDADPVVVVEVDQAAKLEVTGQRSGLV